MKLRTVYSEKFGFPRRWTVLATALLLSAAACWADRAEITGGSGGFIFDIAEDSADFTFAGGGDLLIPGGGYDDYKLRSNQVSVPAGRAGKVTIPVINLSSFSPNGLLYYPPTGIRFYVEADLAPGLGSATTTTIENWGSGTLRTCPATDFPYVHCTGDWNEDIFYNPQTVRVEGYWTEGQAAGGDVYFLTGFHWDSIPEPGAAGLLAVGLAIAGSAVWLKRSLLKRFGLKPDGRYEAGPPTASFSLQKSLNHGTV